MRKGVILVVGLLFVCSFVGAQDYIYPLYKGKQAEEILQSGQDVPELQVFVPDNPNGQTVLICPGGGYKGLSFSPEGVAVAKWLNQSGITGAVLRYRMPQGRFDVPLTDAKAAMEICKKKAGRWGVDKEKIGVMGFSAGGHLASTVLVCCKNELKPDFAILVYPVISMETGITHSASRFNLMGRTPSQELIDKFSSEKHVDETTSPTLIFHCSDDPAVKPMNSIVMYNALQAQKVPVEMHIFNKGGHGWGVANTAFPYYDQFHDIVLRWLAEQR